MAKGTGKVIAVNKKANHDFAIEETIEAGIVLARNRNQIRTKRQSPTA